jgi:hypothetical protein
MKPHEEWLFKAENDLSSADLLVNSSRPLFDIAIYHTQHYLNPYSTLYRYPDGDLMPPRAEVIKAIAVADRILDFVKIKINS